METIKLTDNKTGNWTLVEGNKIVVAWLWKNYGKLGYNEIENLTLMARTR